MAFCLITSLFFLWGFAHNLDPIIVPFCCFVVIALFGYKGYQVNIEKPSSALSSITQA